MLVFIKDIETRQGVISKAHAVGAIRVTLYSDGVDPDSQFEQPALIEIPNYCDKTAVENGKARLQTSTYIILDVSKLSSYPTLVQEIAQELMTNPDSPLYGATIESTDGINVLGSSSSSSESLLSSNSGDSSSSSGE